VLAAHARLTQPTVHRIDSGGTRAFHEREFLSVWHDMGLAAATGSPPPELRARFAATATQGVIGWWLECGQDVSATTIARWLWQLVGPLGFWTASRRCSPSTDPPV
jgi:hypothetical protein